MEIKVICGCGSKYKFDVEPVNGQMPWPVSCPSCGADGTAAANEVLRQSPPPAPITMTPAAPPTGLRITHQDGPTAPPPPATVPRRIQAPSPQAKPQNRAVQVLTAVGMAVLVCFGAWRFGTKWFHRLSAVADIASVVGGASVDSSEASPNENLWYEDCSVLFIKHTNHLEVAEACKAYWKEKLHKQLTVTETLQEIENPGEYELVPAYNGYVRIIGAFEWPTAQLEGLAQSLSQQFGTLVFEWRSEHVADTYHFGVYQEGARKFHARMDIKMSSDDADEIVTTEGNEWAIGNGFKPGTKGFKDFNVLDADKITQHLGMKLWDEPEGKEVKGWLMREAGAGGG